MSVTACASKKISHKWSALFLLCAAIFVAFPHSAWGTPEMKRNLIMKSKLKEGPVQLLKGPSICQEGDLSIVDLGDELTLMLGAHPLAVGLGKGDKQYAEDECRYDETTSTKTGEIIWTQKQNCTIPTARSGKREEIVERKVVITANKKGFKYVRTNTMKGDSKTITCEYAYVK